MDILSHGVGGYFILLLLILSPIPIELNTILIILTFFISMLPDLDGLWTTRLKSHHRGFLHTPFFWIIISTIIYFTLSKEYGILVGCLTLFHLFCDFITGRTVGISVFYPFVKKEYSLVKTHPCWGLFNPKKIFSKDYKIYVKHYFENKKLIIFEVIVWIVGLCSFFYIYYPL